MGFGGALPSRGTTNISFASINGDALGSYPKEHGSLPWQRTKRKMVDIVTFLKYTVYLEVAKHYQITLYHGGNVLCIGPDELG